MSSAHSPGAGPTTAQPTSAEPVRSRSGEAGTPGGSSGAARSAGPGAAATVWVPGTSAVLTGGLGMVLLVLGVTTSRPDLAALALPMVLGMAWAWFSQPRQDVQAQLRPGLSPGAGTAPGATGAAEPGTVGATLTLRTPPGTSVVRMRVATHGYRTTEAVVVASPDRSIGMSLETARTGVLECFRVDYIATSHDELLASHCPPAGPVPMMVRPPARPLRRMPLPFRLQGLVGPHTSRRVGEGMELHDIHEFTPGDRLRRIDWRTTVRRSLDPRTQKLGALYVRRTLASADATVMLVVDSRDDVGPDVDTWSGGTPARMTHATSVDLAREAATSVAQYYLKGGDRVGLDDLGRRRRPVAPAAGGKHLERITQRLARIAPEGSPQPRQRSPRLPSGALAVIFSTFLDDEASAVAILWRSQGHRVIAVDVLPTLNTARLDPYAATSFQLIRLERGLRLAELRRQGIDVVHWVGDPDGHGTAMKPEEALMVASTVQRGGR